MGGYHLQWTGCADSLHVEEALSIRARVSLKPSLTVTPQDAPDYFVVKGNQTYV